MADAKKYENGGTSNGSQLNGMPQSNASSTCSSGSNGELPNGATALTNGYVPSTAATTTNSAVAGLANALYGSYASNSPYRTTLTSPPEQTTILQLGQTLAGVPQETVPYVMNNFAQMVSVCGGGIVDHSLVGVGRNAEGGRLNFGTNR